MEQPTTKMPSKASGWLGKLTAKPPKSQNGHETLPVEATTANVPGEGDDEKGSGRSREKRPYSSQLQTRSRSGSGSGSQQADFTTGSDTLGRKPAPAEKVAGGASEDDSKEYISGVPLFAVMAGATLTCFIMLLDMSIISTAVPYITSEFKSLAEVGWYGAAYQLSSASLQPLTGKFYTYFKIKWLFLTFLFMFELGSLVCGLANSSSMLIGGRAIAGIGASGIMNGGMTMIAGAVPLHKRPLYTGILMGCSQVGIICGPVVGGALTQYASWRWCFFINLPVGGLVALLMLFTKVPDLTIKAPFSLALIRRTIPELDLMGFALFAPASVMFLLALQWGNTRYPWNSSVIIGMFCGAAATAAVFAIYESRIGDKAMIPGSIVRRRIVLSSAINAMGLMGAIFAASQYLPIYFQGVRGEGPAMSGVDLLPGILGQLMTVVVSGTGVSKLGYYMPFSIACGVVSAIGNGLVSTFTPDTPIGKWVGYQLLLGAGRGMGMQMSLIATQNVLSVDQIPVGVAFVIFCQNFSGASLVVVATAIFDQVLTTEIQAHAPSVSPAAALAAGASASGVRALVPEGSPELAGVLLAFSNAVSRVFYLCLACSIVVFLSAWGMGWVDTRKKKSPATAEV